MPEIADLVWLFYQQLWNQRDFGVANQILHEQVSFRGSLGQTMVGRDKACDYVRSVTNALDNYTCDVQSLVVQGEKAAAKVLFSGIHIGEFMSHAPTGKEVSWMGATFFKSKNGLLTEIWVLGDMQGLISKLEQNKS